VKLIISAISDLSFFLFMDQGLLLITHGARGGAVVEALRYKPEGRGIDSRWCH
jgi:hypothetical protein